MQKVCAGSSGVAQLVHPVRVGRAVAALEVHFHVGGHIAHRRHCFAQLRLGGVELFGPLRACRRVVHVDAVGLHAGLGCHVHLLGCVVTMDEP